LGQIRIDEKEIVSIHPGFTDSRKAILSIMPIFKLNFIESFIMIELSLFIDEKTISYGLL
jgi:hypothetical protein